MIRQGQYKYVYFRNYEPLLFDLANDPGEQHNLIGSSDREVAEVERRFAVLAHETMDFDAAEQERIEGEERLHTAYPLGVGPTFGNQYLTPNGLLIEADDTLYDPMVISDEPANLFADWPGDR